MAVELKPTQDPSLDTFKIEYLLGGSAVLGILFPQEYEVMQVRPPMRCPLPPARKDRGRWC